MFLGTNVSGHSHVCAQSCGHNHVWVEMCVGTNVYVHKRVWAQMCLGTNVSGHKRVWAQSCGHSRVGTIMYGHKRGETRCDKKSATNWPVVLTFNCLA